MGHGAHLGYTAPEGFDGVHMMRSLERGVSAARSCSAVMRKPSAVVVSTITGSAPAPRMCTYKRTLCEKRQNEAKNLPEKGPKRLVDGPQGSTPSATIYA